MIHRILRWVRPGAFSEDLHEITGPIDAAMRKLAETIARKPGKAKVTPPIPKTAPAKNHDSDEFRVMHV